MRIIGNFEEGEGEWLEGTPRCAGVTVGRGNAGVALVGTVERDSRGTHGCLVKDEELLEYSEWHVASCLASAKVKAKDDGWWSYTSS